MAAVINCNRVLRFSHQWDVKRMRRRGVSLAPPVLCCRTAAMPSNPNLEILKSAREKFTQEISLKSKDEDISLAKVKILFENVLQALLYVAAEDEAFTAFNRDLDAQSYRNERNDVVFDSQLESDTEEIFLAGKSISRWLNELDVLAKEVEAELVSREIGCHLVEVLKAVNVVLFELRGFKRFPVLLDSNFSYLHTVLSSGLGSAIMLSIIYIEICRKININMVGANAGENFLIWPQTGYLEELFSASSGQSLFSIVNGRCVEDPRSKASDLNSKSLSTLDIATNRDIIGIALANLIRLHWKRASRASPGLMLTSPLRSVSFENDKGSLVETPMAPLLRPQGLRLAIMASERLLLLQPHNWVLMRDHGMLLYYNRRYKEAVHELSICMAFAPVEEVKVLERFVEKLHLLRIESSWRPGSIPVP